MPNIAQNKQRYTFFLIKYNIYGWLIFMIFYLWRGERANRAEQEVAHGTEERRGPCKNFKIWFSARTKFRM